MTLFICTIQAMLNIQYLVASDDQQEYSLKGWILFMLLLKWISVLLHVHFVFIAHTPRVKKCLICQHSPLAIT